jgi:DNA-binding protein Fis
MILAPGGQIGPEHLPPPAPPSFASGASSEQTLSALLRQWAEAQLRSSDDAADLYDRLLKLVEPPVLRAVVQHFHGQCAAAARRLGLHRTTLRKKLDELGLPDDESQP